MRKRESEVRVRATKDKERKKITKILNANATITMHICTVTVAIVHLCTILHPLMWVFFWLKCVKLITFFILHNFATSDAVALKCVMAYGSGFFFFFSSLYNTY